MYGTVQGGLLRRGGMTPALAPRMPGITEDAVKEYRQIEAVNATVLPRSISLRNKSWLNEEKEALGGIRFNERQQLLQQHNTNSCLATQSRRSSGSSTLYSVCINTYQVYNTLYVVQQYNAGYIRS